MDALWTIQKIMDNPNNKIEININKGDTQETIHGFAVSDTFSFSTGASYSEIADVMAELGGSIFDSLPLGDTIRSAVSKATGIINTVNVGASLIGKGKSVVGSVKKWDGSVQQLPPIQLLFVALQPDDRPQDNAKKLLAMCMPGTSILDGIQVDEAFFWAPNGYSPARVLESVVRSEGVGYAGYPIVGTCNVKIGRWFEAQGLLPEAASFDLSKETTRSGNPLYVTGSVSFTTYRDMKAKDYEKMFLNT